MFSDDRLENLLRAAKEVDAFERGEAARLSGGAWTNGRGDGRGRRLGWLLAAAAALALIVTPVMLVRSARGTKAGAEFAHGSVPTKLPKPADASLLLAVYQNDAGKFSCVNWSADALKGRKVSSLSAEELRRLGLTLSCDPEAARILVVGLEGPAAALQMSDARAHEVGQCLSSSPPCSSGTFNPRTCASAGCLGQDVTVRIESLALK